ncbi:hypothetical protein [Streptomyces sp. GSL17-111]|uniref:hypothetical protein n=1 Tax=Streptomyces sp. GSL17-111 TaxID=3121596 RepID=UPI0030F4298D
MRGGAEGCRERGAAAERGGRVEIVVVRRSVAAPVGQTTVVRLLGLLPSHWRCVPQVETDRIRLRVALPGTGGRAAVRRVVADVLADRALRGWAEEPGGWAEELGGSVRPSPAHGRSGRPAPGWRRPGSA